MPSACWTLIRFDVPAEGRAPGVGMLNSAAEYKSEPHRHAGASLELSREARKNLFFIVVNVVVLHNDVGWDARADEA